MARVKDKGRQPEDCAAHTAKKKLFNRAPSTFVLTWSLHFPWEPTNVDLHLICVKYEHFLLITYQYISTPEASQKVSAMEQKAHICRIWQCWQHIASQHQERVVLHSFKINKCKNSQNSLTSMPMPMTEDKYHYQIHHKPRNSYYKHHCTATSWKFQKQPKFIRRPSLTAELSIQRMEITLVMKSLTPNVRKSFWVILSDSCDRHGYDAAEVIGSYSNGTWSTKHS